MGNGVEVARHISVYHLREPLVDQLVHFPEGVLASATRTKAIARFRKFMLENRFYHYLQRRLDDAIFDRWYSQRTLLAGTFGNFYAFDRLGLIGSRCQRLRKFLKIRCRPVFKPLYTLAVHACRTLVASYFAPCNFKGAHTRHFVDQAEPLTSFDAVFQRRQHALEASAQLWASVPCLASPRRGTADTVRMHCLFLEFTHPPSCPPSLITALLSVLLAAAAAAVLVRELAPAVRRRDQRDCPKRRQAPALHRRCRFHHSGCRPSRT
jgi:hypothetical protein